MSYTLFFLLLGATTICVLFRAADPFRIAAMQRAMRSADPEALQRLFNRPANANEKGPPELRCSGRNFTK